MVILIDAERRSDWLVKAIDRRLREEFAKLRVEINEDKSRMVDLKSHLQNSVSRVTYAAGIANFRIGLSGPTPK
jgi:hypothetical protein